MTHRALTVLLLLLTASLVMAPVCGAVDSEGESGQKVEPLSKDAQFFQWNTPGGNLSLLLMQWDDGRWMLNVEPGCIAAEVKHEKVGKNTYRFTFLGWGMVDRAKQALAIKGNCFEVEYEERSLPTMLQVTKITEVADSAKAAP